MSVSNEAILRKGIEEFRRQQYDKLEKKLIVYCGEILRQALNFRLLTPDAHNFTGNLINSIVVGLYREGNLVMFVMPGSEQGIDRPVMKKMSYPFKYYFSETKKKSRGGRRSVGLDWDQTHPSSFYAPELKTNLIWGFTDAKHFIRSYQPKGKSVFEIVVGYTTEYASFVETKRHTTGYMQTVDWVQMTINDRIS